MEYVSSQWTKFAGDSQALAPDRQELAVAKPRESYGPLFSLVMLVPFVWACGATIPPPAQRLADAQSAGRSARELGANDIPVAQLSLRLAEDQIAQAQKSMTDGDNKRADSLLIRAKADAELAVAQAREKGAKVDGQKAVDDSAEQKATNIGQGAVK